MTESDSLESSSNPEDQRCADGTLHVAGSSAHRLPSGTILEGETTYVSPAVSTELFPSGKRLDLHYPILGPHKLPGLALTPVAP